MIITILDTLHFHLDYARICSQAARPAQIAGPTVTGSKSKPPPGAWRKYCLQSTIELYGRSSPPNLLNCFCPGLQPVLVRTGLIWIKHAFLLPAMISPKMNAMRLGRRARVFVAWLAALLLVMCQTAFAAQACAADLARPATTTTSAPCHEADHADSSVPAHAASACEATKAVADPVKLPAFSIADTPTTLVAFPAPVAGKPSLAIQHVYALCHSPPLTVLHCRFLN